jgi:predicted phage tail protein
MQKKDEETIVIRDKRDKNISQSKKTNVNLKKNKNSMEIENVISELKDLLGEKKFSQEAIASMTSTFADAIKEKDEAFRAELKQTKEDKEALANEHAELKSSVEELKSKFEEAQTKIADYEAAQKAEEAVARFNERMDCLDQKFDLEDEDKEFLAQELKSVEDSEEAFASFETKMDLVWKHKNKEAKAEFEKQVQARIEQEVEKRLSKDGEVQEKTEESVATKTEEEILDDVKSEEVAIANSNETLSREVESLKDKFSAAFDRSNIEIS